LSAVRRSPTIRTRLRPASRAQRKNNNPYVRGPCTLWIRTGNTDGMDRSDIRIDITLRLDSLRAQTDIPHILRALSTLDGIGAMRLADTSGRLLRLSFDPYRISARDILKWFAQQTIKANLLPAPNAALSTAESPTSAAP
jgi:hypothetical protein